MWQFVSHESCWKSEFKSFVDGEFYNSKWNVLVRDRHIRIRIRGTKIFYKYFISLVKSWWDRIRDFRRFIVNATNVIDVNFSSVLIALSYLGWEETGGIFIADIERD